jgi:membrane protein implicated in regulation of membrane protease activity
MPEDFSDSFSKLANDTQQYIATYIDLLKIKGSKVLINVFASIINILIIAILGAFSALFFGIASAKQLNQLLKSDTLGYWIVGGLFLVLTVIFISISKKLVFGYFRRHILKNIYNED